MSGTRESIFRFGDIEVREREFSLVKAGEVIPVEPKAFRVLLFLLHNPQKLITKEELLNAVWGETAVSENSLTRSIALLRHLLGDDTHQPRFIETVATVGYRFVCIVEMSEGASGIVTSGGQAPANEGVAEAAANLPAQTGDVANGETKDGMLDGGDDPRLKQSIADLKRINQDLKEESGPCGAPLTGARRFTSRWLAAGLAIVLLAGVLIGLILRNLTQAAPSLPVVRAEIKVEQGLWLGGIVREREGQRPSRTSMVMSRDGRFIVYSAIAENPGPQAKAQLYLRRIDQSEARVIAGTEGGISPFLSPDDRWVGFWADGKLMKVSVDGGVPVTLCNTALLFGASWGLDDRIIFANAFDSGLFRVSAGGGDPESLITPDRTKQEYGHRLPYCLPDGKRVLFTIMGDPFDLHPRTALLDLKSRKWRVLVEDAADARYVPTGHLVFLREGTLMAVPFDLRSSEVMGQPVPVIANVLQALNAVYAAYNTAAGQFSTSDSGFLVYAEGGIFPDKLKSLVWVDQQGRAEAIASFKAPFVAPRLSPDGQRIAYTTGGKEKGVWVYDLNRGTASRLTGEGKALFVNWTPDGKRLVFDWGNGPTRNLYWRAADGSTAMERLTTSENYQFPGSWSPDGYTLAFQQQSPDAGDDICLLDLRSRRTTSFLHSGTTLWYPEFSPDGRWMAYASDESGRMEVYVRPFPGPGGKWLISQQGGIQPLWARNGKQLFYRSGKQLFYRSLFGNEGRENEIWAVDIRTDGGFSAGKPRLLFDVPRLEGSVPIRGWDLSMDGHRFLMVKVDDEKPVPVIEMVLVMNWSQELQRLAPSAKK